MLAWYYRCNSPYVFCIRKACAQLWGHELAVVITSLLIIIIIINNSASEGTLSR
jgi:hypothetical protein